MEARLLNAGFDVPGEPLVEKDKKDPNSFDCDEVIEQVGFGSFQIWLGLLAGALFATDAIQMTMLSFTTSAARCTFGLNVSEGALIASACFGGNLIGSYWCGALADKYGRRLIFLGAAACQLVFAVLSALATSYELLLAAQFLVGFGIGAVPVAFTLYAEFVPVESRGRRLVSLQISWTIGCVAEAGLAWLVVPTLGWRWLVLLSAAPCLLLLLAAPWLPESPKWQAAHGRQEEAFATLQRVGNANGIDRLVCGKPSQLRVAPEPENDVSLLDLFRDGYARLTVVVWALWILGTLLYYAAILLATEVRELAGETEDPCFALQREDYVMAAVTATAELPAFVAAVYMVDSLGRPHTIAISFLVMAIALVAVLLCAGEMWAETVCLFGARAAVMCGCLAFYIGTGELYPTKMRTTGLGTANAVARLGGFAAPFIASVLLDTSRVASLLALGAISLVTAWVGLKLPETSGTLE